MELQGAGNSEEQRGTAPGRAGRAAGVLAARGGGVGVGSCCCGWAGRHSLAPAPVKDSPVGIQLLILAQIGSLVFNKGAKFPFKNPAGI